MEARQGSASVGNHDGVSGSCRNIRHRHAGRPHGSTPCGFRLSASMRVAVSTDLYRAFWTRGGQPHGAYRCSCAAVMDFCVAAKNRGLDLLATDRQPASSCPASAVPDRGLSRS
jgi:hypothetical protein